MNQPLTPAPIADAALGGPVGALLRGVTEHWLLGIRESQPAILDMLRAPDDQPHRDLLPWSGEFAGKYLTAATLVYRVTRDERLLCYLKGFVAELISCQQPNGYLGCFAKDEQLTGRRTVVDEQGEHEADSWDPWCHYHLMMGLYTWYRETGDEAAFACVKRVADLFCRLFYNEQTGRRLLHTGSPEMNYAPGHIFALLYNETKNEAYLRFALEVLQDFAAEGCGDYYRRALAGEEYYRTPKPRWESIHSIQMLGELYRATGEQNYLTALTQIWRSMTKTDLHNTGGFSTEEQAVGNPFTNGNIETCCTVAYLALTADVLRLTGDPAAADVLELATYNNSLACFAPTGRWSTYNTPMAGEKRANFWQIGFQCRPGSPELNCCSVNAPRLLGELAEWAYMTCDEGLTVNFYAPSAVTLALPGGRVRVEQTTDYPAGGEVTLRFFGLTGRQTLRLRVPFWSEQTEILVGGRVVARPAPGYALLTREWGEGDSVTLRFDCSLRFARGEKDFTGCCSVTRGPLLLAYDGFYNPGPAAATPPVITPGRLRCVGVRPAHVAGSLFTMQNDGQTFTLCDMQAAGSSGSRYTTWLPVAAFAAPAMPPHNLNRSFKVE